MDTDQLLLIIKEKRPSTVGALRGILSEMSIQLGDEELATLLRQLSYRGLANFNAGPESFSFSDYLINLDHSRWMYLSLVIALSETLLVESKSPEVVLAGLRLVLGFALLGIVPGYSMLRLVFPRGGLGVLEQGVLSVFLSILVSILTGVVLGAEDALEATSNVLMLSVLTFAFSVSAAYRDYRLLSQG